MDTRIILAEQIAAKRLKPHHIVGSVKPNDSIVIGDKRVSVRKVKSGQFQIQVGDADKDTGEVVDTLDGPTPAKLAFIDKMVELVTEQSEAAAAGKK